MLECGNKKSVESADEQKKASKDLVTHLGMDDGVSAALRRR